MVRTGPRGSRGTSARGRGGAQPKGLLPLPDLGLHSLEARAPRSQRALTLRGLSLLLPYQELAVRLGTESTPLRAWSFDSNPNPTPGLADVALIP